MANDFCYVELTTDDPNRAKQFYGKLFEWRFEDTNVDGASYSMIRSASGIIGGIMKSVSPDTSEGWLAYVEVEDADRTLERVKELGGTVIVPKQLVQDYGYLAVIHDPGGAPLALWEPLRGD